MIAVVDPEDADLLVVPRRSGPGRPSRWYAWFNPGFQGGWMVTRNDYVHSPRIHRFLHREIGLRVAGLAPSPTIRVAVRDGSYLNCRRSNLHVYEKASRRIDAAGPNSLCG